MAAYTSLWGKKEEDPAWRSSSGPKRMNLSAAGFEQHSRDFIRVAVRVGASVFQVALAVVRHASWNTDRGSTIRNTVLVFVPETGLVGSR